MHNSYKSNNDPGDTLVALGCLVIVILWGIRIPFMVLVAQAIHTVLPDVSGWILYPLAVLFAILLPTGNIQSKN